MISPYLKNLIQKTGGGSGPIGLQFIAQPKNEKKFEETSKTDPLIEQINEVAPGLIYKYKGKIDKSGEVEYYGRALWTISRYCASYCRFCFRGRMVGLPATQALPSSETLMKKPYLSSEDIDTVIGFLKKHSEINEVILSGGDPLITPQPYFETIITQLSSLQKNNQLDIVRIHTRAPVTNPETVKDWHYEQLEKITNPYIVLHVNHPFEITSELEYFVNKIRSQCNALVLSQTVFLKGINNNVKTLQDLFNKLTKIGVRPYYLHNNDPVYWARHFTIPPQEALKIWHELRPRLSGIAASAKFVIDTPYGYGKIPFPELGWKVDTRSFSDFNNIEYPLS